MAYLLFEVESKEKIFQRLVQDIINIDIISVKTYIQQGFDINSKDINNWTLLHFCVLHSTNFLDDRRKKLFNFLIDSGANIEAKDDSGRTPLIQAARYNLENVVKLLLDAGADKEAKDNNGKTALDWVKEFSKNKDLIKILTPPEFPEFLTENWKKGYK